ncbi:TrmH family RNA methyltransferase [Pseudohoeflea coraliihabitans]|uniref:RNA methyltransferase n=1 Tax=Pseudohoeflea coraliihabitans TaxID=2860393 RepID=A0ABS6WNQ6_9HYPH|nr:RNA methyltransferase [Pseudohoeflea sp. DP4N28-3]MBW3097599.1 RNA methyltransferase [Pseudohoeflea sp. DP4N28-3]
MAENHKRQRVGQVKEITSLANPVIKDIRALAQKKRRDETGTFLAEGRKLVIDALELGWQIRTLIYAKALRGQPQVEAIAAKTVARGGLVLEVSEKVLTAITRRDNPQAVIGVFDQQYSPLDAAEMGANDTWVALDRVRDPGNLGTIVRTADAAGVRRIVLVGETVDPFSMEAVRATMGSIFAVSLSRASAAELLAWHRTSGAQLVGSHLAGSSDYRSIDYAGRPQVLLMGNEQAGLPEGLARACDRLARIPQAGRADSLNLAIATGLMIFEARRHLLSLDVTEADVSR